MDKKLQANKIEIFQLNEFSVYEVSPITLKLKCDNCHHTFVIDVRNGTNRIDLICRKCAAETVLDNLNNCNKEKDYGNKN